MRISAYDLKQDFLAMCKRMTIYFDNREICAFLNTAWEMLHNQKVKALSDVLMSQEFSTTQMESLLYMHDQLYRVTRPIPEIAHDSPFWSKNEVDKTSKNSRIYILPDWVGEFGPPTIVHCTIHEFPARGN